MTTILGNSSKFRPGGLTVNFGRSAGVYCWDGCRLYNAGCYAQRLEGRHDRQQLHRKLKRLERLDPNRLCYAATAELQSRLYQGHQVPWFRFAMAGSVPQPKHWNGDTRGLRLLCEVLVGAGLAPDLTHFPVEQPSKARWYDKQIGDLVTVRQSIQTSGVRAGGPCSFVAGGADDQMTRRERLELAKQIAKDRTKATGRPAKVCPHIEWATLHHGEAKNPRAKCGEGGCTGCADPTIDIVYPFTS